jgi:hypothetical protein
LSLMEYGILNCCRELKKELIEKEEQIYDN